MIRTCVQLYCNKAMYYLFITQTLVLSTSYCRAKTRHLSPKLSGHNNYNKI